MRKIIVPVGYMGTGSSAVTDLISEFENVNNEYGDFEYVFLHCPNGLFDLEDKLLVNNNALRSDEAIHTYLKEMKDLYSLKYWWVANYKDKIGVHFYERTEEFIKKITMVSLNDYWYYQEKPNFKIVLYLIFRKLLHFLTFKKVLLEKPRLYKEMHLSYVTPEEFYKEAKKYVSDILNMIDSNPKDLLLDQLILPYNLNRINNYFDKNIRVIVVNKDPRDLFILNKYIWHKKQIGVAYSTDANEFCKQFKRIQELTKRVNDNKILFVQFEDLVYKYDDTVKKIVKFLGYEDRKQLYKMKKFNPSVSIANTQLFNNEKYKDEIKIIEKELKDYLYDFPYYLENDVESSYK